MYSALADQPTVLFKSPVGDTALGRTKDHKVSASDVSSNKGDTSPYYVRKLIRSLTISRSSLSAIEIHFL